MVVWDTIATQATLMVSVLHAAASNRCGWPFSRWMGGKASWRVLRRALSALIKSEEMAQNTARSSRGEPSLGPGQMGPGDLYSNSRI